MFEEEELRRREPFPYLERTAATWEEHKDLFLDNARKERKQESVTLSEQVLGVVPLRQRRYQVAFWTDTVPVAAGIGQLPGEQESSGSLVSKDYREQHKLNAL